MKKHALIAAAFAPVVWLTACSKSSDAIDVLTGTYTGTDSVYQINENKTAGGGIRFDTLFGAHSRTVVVSKMNSKEFQFKTDGFNQQQFPQQIKFGHYNYTFSNTKGIRRFTFAPEENTLLLRDSVRYILSEDSSHALIIVTSFTGKR